MVIVNEQGLAMKLETLISLVLFALLMLLVVVERDVVYFLGMFAIGWQLPAIGKALASRFRNRNRVEA